MMTRSLAALICFSAACLGTPSRSEAGVIPWMYDSIFGYGPRGYGWGAGYGGYTTGYAPFYQPYYAASYGGGNCCGVTTNYAPWTGFATSSGCCSPCGTGSCGSCNPCGSGCGTGCDPGCGNNCPGGNCGASSGSNTVPSTPTDQGTGQGTGQTPTYAPPANTNDRTLPADQFAPANRDRNRAGAGSTVPSTGGFNQPATSTPMAEPNSSAPSFGTPAPGEPGYFQKKDDQSRENGSVVPKLGPTDANEKVAFKTPVRFSRTQLEPAFELPAIVSAPARTLPLPTAVPTAVASK